MYPTAEALQYLLMGLLSSAAVVLRTGFLLREEMQALIAKIKTVESRLGGSCFTLRL